jgi:(p)ppGpp synthase/HD superfamily hydrolase
LGAGTAPATASKENDAVATEFPVPTFLERLPLARRAFEYARELHRDQRREVDAAPFIVHPLEVASLLHNTGHAEHVVAAGLLHDSVEDTDARIDDVLSRFGSEVAELVRAMTEDPAIESYAERKAALRDQIRGFGPDATAVYAADKVAKVRELRALAGREPDVLEGERPAAAARLDHYVESLRTLESVAPDHSLVRQLRLELEMLSARTAGAAE